MPRDYKSKFGLLNRSRDDLNFHPDERVLSAQLTHLEAILTASARATKSIDGRLFADRVNQLDLRLSKGVQFERYRVEVLADFYNAFNTSPVLSYTTVYGPAWLTPASILRSAFVKFGARLTF